MLKHLSVRDFAIVEAVDIELGPGLTVVTGETGAGKSLLVDALLLLSGTRADSALVRSGCQRAELSASFDLDDAPDAAAWLAERELDEDGECLLRRVIRAEGASRAWINGRPVPAQSLNELSALLVEIHGQHEHQTLLDRGAQLRLLDSHGGHGELAAQVRDLAQQWQGLDARRQALADQAGDDGGRADLLRHHLGELEGIVLSPDGLAALESEHRRLSHLGETLAACVEARERLDGDDSGAVLAALSRIRQAIERASGLDPSLAGIVELLASADVELREAGRALDAWLDGGDLDPERLAQLDRQLSRLHELARKHRVPPQDLSRRREELEADLAVAENASTLLADLEHNLDTTRTQWHQAAVELGAARRSAAAELANQVSALMAELGMGGGRFEIGFTAVTGDTPDRQGGERIEFMVAANPGQVARPLRKVASGGELSRIALAIEVAALGNDPVPTMVFDEVDSGIGGAVAEILGQKLRRLGGHAQVLCVTHLAQVAAQGHAQVAVRKHDGDSYTGTLVTALDEHERALEIARMLGGVELTDTTLAHARQMLARAAKS